MSYIRVGAPRNTSNGDYGRFLFASNMSSSSGHHQNAQYSTDGNRMMQHVHYPNCPNQNAPNKFSDGMKEYTIEYGEDAVRAALGGNMPDFQAEFQKQYGNYNEGAAAGNTGSSCNINPQAVQMVNDGKSKIAMIPVVLTSEGDDQEDQKVATGSRTDNISNRMDKIAEAPGQSCNGDAPPSTEVTAPPNETTEIRQESTGATMVSKQENITNAFESVRKARSTGQVKYGRHIRPSYWKPETPNPCRKKIPGGGCGDMNDAVNDSQQHQDISGYQQATASNLPYMENSHGMTTNANAYFAPPPMMSPNVQQQNTLAYQRTRSLPQRQSVRPAYSLCGKCKKCRNLRSETPEASVLTFPKYSTGGFQRQTQTLTSSNLGQSAKNFRAIRFSSTHM